MKNLLTNCETLNEYMAMRLVMLEDEHDKVRIELDATLVQATATFKDRVRSEWVAHTETKKL